MIIKRVNSLENDNEHKAHFDWLNSADRRGIQKIWQEPAAGQEDAHQSTNISTNQATELLRIYSSEGSPRRNCTLLVRVLKGSYRQGYPDEDLSFFALEKTCKKKFQIKKTFPNEAFIGGALEISFPKPELKIPTELSRLPRKL